MTDDLATSRARHLLPEELAVSSDDPEAQAEALLAESERRVERRDPAIERRTSAEAAG
jgi:hypothetical protein